MNPSERLIQIGGLGRINLLGNVKTKEVMSPRHATLCWLLGDPPFLSFAFIMLSSVLCSIRHSDR